MKVTFPNLGSVSEAMKILFDGLQIDYVVPPVNNKEALQIGAKYSPEEMCTPFKIMIGNYIQSIKKGADTILLVGSCGPCRFGEYFELQMRILKKLGYHLKFVVLDSPEEIGIRELLNRINYVLSQSSLNKINKILSIKRALKAIILIEDTEKMAHGLAGYEINRGEFKRILYKCKRDLSKTNNPIEALDILKTYKKTIENIDIDKEKNPLKIEIIGEIYTIMDSFSNLNIENKLMDYGVSSRRKLTASWWMKDALMSILNLNSIDIRRASKKYLKYYIGGHARECIGEAILAKKENFHGAIQIFPVGCMPQIVSKAILPKISKEYDFPIMTLVVDEMTGEAGYVTRIEAFLDLIERRRKCII